MSITGALRRRQTYAGQVQEAVAAARCVVLYPLGLAEKSLTTGRPRGDATLDTPVLLVHGSGHNRSGWFSLERSLRNAGFTSIHTLNHISWRNDGVPELAQRLADRVEEIRRITGAPKVHLVGHSLGGLLLRWYVQELDGHRCVDTAITVASPHEGTVAALLAPGPCARDLRPGSRVIRRLNHGAGGLTASDVRWVALYSNLDLLVQPAVSGRLRSPALAAENVLIRDHGHVMMMTSPRVVREIVARLVSGRSANEVVPLRVSPLPEPARRHDQPAAQQPPRGSDRVTRLHAG